PSYIEAGIERDDFDEIYALPPKFYFYPAQFWSHKNHLRLVHALLRARAECPDMTLVLAGEMRLGYQAILNEVVRVGLEDAVRFVGYVPDGDMASFYKRAHGLVMPTFFGPTNIPPLEAMAMGCPVIVSGTYAMPEQCGEAALYFDPTSEEEMSTRMVRLWSDEGLRQRLSAAGRNRTQAWGQTQFQDRLARILEFTLTRA
ncbi:MAG: glycosyltransferase family 4 protein, partial [Gammaproteobacteria bacterium]|nr:glycosyltransferase family 4 protein [Gammaproteobacteria bacterium]